jgi:hypothetical protein
MRGVYDKIIHISDTTPSTPTSCRSNLRMKRVCYWWRCHEWQGALPSPLSLHPRPWPSPPSSSRFLIVNQTMRKHGSSPSWANKMVLHFMGALLLTPWLPRMAPTTSPSPWQSLYLHNKAWRYTLSMWRGECMTRSCTFPTPLCWPLHHATII